MPVYRPVYRCLPVLVFAGAISKAALMGYNDFDYAGPAVTVEAIEFVEETRMPLRDHFHPPLSEVSSWEEVHGQWPMVIVQQLGKKLPPQYTAGPRVHLGAEVEIDVATFESETAAGHLAPNPMTAALPPPSGHRRNLRWPWKPSGGLR